MGSSIKGVQAFFILILLCLFFYLPGLQTMPPTDRDESRFAQATTQMLESHDFVRIRFQDEPRNKKPVGIHWLQAASVAIAGQLEARNIWPYRIPSLFGAIAAVLFTFSMGRRLFDNLTALLGSALLASSVMLVAEAHLATTDAVLLATVVASQAALSRYYLRSAPDVPAGMGPFLTFWTAQAIGILVKGPITPVISLLTVVALIAVDRSFRWLRGMRPLPGLLIVAAIVLPWGIAVYLAQDTYFQVAFGEDLLSKMTSGQETHGFPPGWYLLLAPLTLWPASFFVIPAMARAWKSRYVGAIKFCLAWIIPAWVLFELIPTKLPHYLLPVYPALCLLSGEMITACAAGKAGELNSKWMRWAAIPCAVLIAVLVTGTSVLPYLTERRIDPAFIVSGLAACISAALFAREFRCGRFIRAACIAVLGTGLVLGPMLQWGLPRMQSVWLSSCVAREAKQCAQKKGSNLLVAAVGYHEPSLVFLLGTRTLLTSSSEAAMFLQNNPTGLALVADDKDEEFRREAARLKLDVVPVSTMPGFNYTTGTKTVLCIYELGSRRRDGETGK